MTPSTNEELDKAILEFRKDENMLTNYDPKPVFTDTRKNPEPAVLGDRELEATLDEIEMRMTTKRRLRIGSPWPEARKEIMTLFASQVAATQTNAVAWVIGLIDDLHFSAEGKDDASFKCIKNTIRDRYKAETGVDSAPNYPINVRLAAPHKEKQL